MRKHNPDNFYNFVCAIQAERKGAPPSIGEVAQHFQTSTCVVHNIFQGLVKTGKLEKKGRHYVAAQGKWRLRNGEEWIYG